MTEPTPPSPAGKGLRAAAAEGDFSMARALGGPRGVLETALPGVLFVLVYTFSDNLRGALWSAVALAAVLALVRLARREDLTQALSGLIGVAVCAWVAARTGRAENFYLPGLLANAAYAAAYAVSILVRWPLLGIIVGSFTGEGFAWRRNPARLSAYQRASWLWVAMFLARIAVQLPLYVAGMVGALGVARVAMGLPLFGVTIYLSWLVLRRVPVTPARA